MAILLQETPVDLLQATPVDPSGVAKEAWEWGGALGLAIITIIVLGLTIRFLYTKLDAERTSRENELSAERADRKKLEEEWRKEQCELLKSVITTSNQYAIVLDRIASALQGCPLKTSPIERSHVSG